MKRILYFILLTIALMCLFTICVSAADVDGVTYTLNSTASPPTASVSGIVSGTSIVKIPSTITVDGTEYRVNAVTGITNKTTANTLVELYITGEYITNLSGFNACTNLKKIYITSPIASYGNDCFLNCSKVEDVYIDFSHTTSIGSNAFLFTSKAETLSKAVWNYNGGPINLYNVTYIGNSAFAASRIGGKFTGGTENTIIWPKKTTYMGSFCFSNCYIGGTVYINSTGVASNKQFSLNNSFETFIIGPDTTTIYNFNNGGDTGFKNSVDTVIILSKGLINGASRTNLFDNWGEFDLYYYSDIQAVINKQTTISGATHHLITSHTLSYDNSCSLKVDVFSDNENIATVNNTHHTYYIEDGVVNQAACPLGASKTVPCSCGNTTKGMLNYGYLEAGEHNSTANITYANGFGESGLYHIYCAACSYDSYEAINPIISSLGYSYIDTDSDRISLSNGYSVNMDAVDLYNEIHGVKLEIGIFFSSAEAVGEALPTSLENIPHFSSRGENKYSTYDYIIRFPSKSSPNYARYATAEFVACAFLYDGVNYSFYQGSNSDTNVSVLESGLTTTTLATISGDSHIEHTGEWVTTPGTCTTPASKERTCSECGEVESIVDESVKGHLWSDWQEGFLYIERACTVDGCGETQRVDYQNITSSAMQSASFEGQAWANNAPGSLFDGNWDDRGIAAKGCDVSTEIILKSATYIDRIYVKGVGGNPAKFTVFVLYDGEGDYVDIGSGSFLTGAQNESTNRTIPYATVDSAKKVLSVKIKVTNSSYGSDLWEEVALIKLPSTDGYVSNETVTVTYNTGIGNFENDFDYEKYVANGGKNAIHPTPVFKDDTKLFTGWYTDINCTLPVSADATYTKNVTLYAGWAENTLCSDGTNSHNVTDWEILVPASCSSTGSKSGACVTCGKTITASIDAIPHTEKVLAGIEPTCIDTGLTEETVCSVCDAHISGGELLAPTGIHTYDENAWTTVVLATKYTNGMATGYCSVCNAQGEKVLPYTATNSELSANNVGVEYTGGKYTNEIFTNLSPLGRVYATSFFNGTKASNAIDKDYNTFWNADTYADGADYLDDYIELELPTKYDIGVVALTVPYYSSYELGSDCYVSYSIEYWNDDVQAWVYLGTVSDKDATPMGANCEAILTLDAPVNAQKIRARVAHASRYAPAVVYELAVYGKANGFDYSIESVAGQASATISGKYNDWVSGAEALLDGDISTYWTTDIRYGGPTWALLEFPTDMYIACLQFTVRNEESRTFTVEIYENGQWTQLSGTYVASRNVGGNIISNVNNTCTFNIDIERSISKIRINLIQDSAYWVSYVHEITPYTVTGATSDSPTTECKHALLTTNKVVAPSCATAGYTLMTCAGCGAEFKTNATDSLTHSFGEYTVATPATATTVGTKISSCANCDATCTITYEESYESPVVTPYRHNAPAAWAQTFDDGNYSDTYEWVIPQLQKYGYRATALLSITFANTHISAWNQRLESGVFDLGSHSYNHKNIYSGDVSSADLLSDVVMAQYWFRSNFKGEKFITFAAPNGATSDAVANYLTGIFAANRNGGQGYAFYNVISDLENGRSTWGNLNSYISKADQTEGDYVFTNANGSIIYTLDENGNYVLNNSYANKNVNYVFDEEEGTFVNKGASAGTYYYVSEDYRYEFRTTGSYNLVDGRFVFVNDNSGEFKLVKATIGSYENAIDTLVSNGAFTVECLHSLGSGSIYSSYNSTISKFEYLAKRGVWAPSYQDLVLYLKEAESAKIETVARTDDSITINVTDELDNYMFDYALTVKVDISDSWKSVVVTQSGVEIPLVDIDTYRASKNMSTVSCAIEGGYLYIDVVPDGGEVVITAEATLEETSSDNAEIGVDIWDILG